MNYFRADSRPGQLARSWNGELLAEETTRTEDRVRWVEFHVYRITDGQGPFLAHTAGMSTVYHRAMTACRTSSNRKPGSVATVDELPDDAEPCSQCSPPYPEDLRDDEQIRFEFPRHTFTEGSAQDIVTELTTYRERGTGLRVTRVSEPVAGLLTELAKVSPEIRAVPWPQTRITPALAQGDDTDGRDDLPGDDAQGRRSDDQAAAPDRTR